MAASGHFRAPDDSNAPEGPWPERLSTDIDRVRVPRHPVSGGPSCTGVWTGCEGGERSAFFGVVGGVVEDAADQAGLGDQ